MADFDITSLLANSAKTNADFDFSKLATAYYEGQKQQYEQRTRDAFQDPSLYGPDGQIDPYKAVQAALKAGGTQGVEPATKVAGIADLLSKFGNTAGLVKDTTGNARPSYYRDPLEQNPPSISGTKGAPAKVAPDLTSGNDTDSSFPNVGSGNTIMKVVAAQGIPNDQIGSVSNSIGRTLGINPNAQINLTDPVFRKSLIDEIGKVKQAGVGAVYPPGQAAPAPQVVSAVQPPPAPVQQAQATPPPQPIVPTQVQTQTIRPQPAPQPADPTLNGLISQRELQLFGTPQNVLAYLEGRLRQGLQPDAQKAVEAKVDKIREALAYTGEQKNAQTPGSISSFEGQKTSAVEQAKAYAEKDKAIDDNRKRALTEVPQLQMLQSQMEDPNFFSGVGEKYNLLYKRLQSAIGINADAAVPQEFLRKATAANVLSSLGNLRGLGPVRVAEMNMAREAQAAPDNSVPANKLLTEISIRTHDRNVEIGDMRDKYLETHASIDRGFDKQVSDYMKANPLFNDAEIKDWHKAISTYKAPNAPTATASATIPAGFPPNAQKARDGNYYVPDPNRPGKYLKVNP